jgi:thiol-disulfide isomerase/thioredoxin
MVEEKVLEIWSAIADTFPEQAIFAYMTESVYDAFSYFGLDPATDPPIIVAQRPEGQHRYKSERLLHAADLENALWFVNSVITGNIGRMIKSEPLPSIQENLASLVQIAVGENVLEVVNAPDKDVLLAVYTPYCLECKELMPAFETLGRAVQNEQRIVVAKINAAANDIPSEWGVVSYPTLLWFRASEKVAESKDDVDPLLGAEEKIGHKRRHTPDSANAAPNPYWDAGYSLSELVGFVLRKSSFDRGSLRVASAEQLHMLLEDEAIQRAQYEKDEHHFKRNEGRVLYESAWADYLLGEVVFDGQRWHIFLVVGFVLLWLVAVTYIATGGVNGSHSKKSVKVK